MIRYKNNHVQETNFSVPVFSRKSDEFVAFCQKTAERTQIFEDAIWNLLENDFNLESANIAQLEQIGTHLLEPLRGRSVSEYQAALSAKWAKLKQYGTPEQLMDICDSMFDQSRTIWQGSDEHKDLINVLLVELNEKPDFEKLTYILSEMKRAKRGGQAIRINLIETKNVFLIPDSSTPREYHLIPENEARRNQLTVPYSIEEAKL